LLHKPVELNRVNFVARGEQTSSRAQQSNRRFQFQPYSILKLLNVLLKAALVLFESQFLKIVINDGGENEPDHEDQIGQENAVAA
jgi:hypothetical protein